MCPSAISWALALGIGVQGAYITRDLIPQPKSTPAPPIAESTPAARPADRSQSMRPAGHSQCPSLRRDQPPRETPAGTARRRPPDAAQPWSSPEPSRWKTRRKASASSARPPRMPRCMQWARTSLAACDLNAVYSDRVILDRGGQLEALYLPRKMAAGGPRSAATAAHSRARSSRTGCAT